MGQARSRRRTGTFGRRTRECKGRDGMESRRAGTFVRAQPGREGRWGRRAEGGKKRAGGTRQGVGEVCDIFGIAHD